MVLGDLIFRSFWGLSHVGGLESWGLLLGDIEKIGGYSILEHVGVWLIFGDARGAIQLRKPNLSTCYCYAGFRV